MIAEVVIRVIAREGLAAATIRRIAAEVGFSTTVVTHYFADKQEMLLSAYRMMGETAIARFREGPLPDAGTLVEKLYIMAAMDETEFDLWHTYIAIWDRSLRDPEFAEELKSWTDRTTARIAEYILQLRPDCPDAERAARRLLSMVIGVSVQILFNRDSWTATAVWDMIAQDVGAVLGCAPPPPMARIT